VTLKLHLPVHSAAGGGAGQYGRWGQPPTAKQLVPHKAFDASCSIQLQGARPSNWAYLARTAGGFWIWHATVRVDCIRSSGRGWGGSGFRLARFLSCFLLRRLINARCCPRPCTRKTSVCCMPACDCRGVVDAQNAAVTIVENIENTECGSARHKVAIRRILASHHAGIPGFKQHPPRAAAAAARGGGAATATKHNNPF
jgi:hypothetical protein